MANETDSVFATDQQNGKGELYRLMMSILKEGETDNQETAQQQQATEVEKANDEPATQQTAVVQTATEPQSVQQPTVQPQEQPKQQAEQPKGEVEQPAQTVQGVQSVQADELDDDTKDLLAVMNHNIDDARKYVEKLGKEAQTIMASGMSEGAKRKAQERYENAAKTLNERIETHNAEQKAENDRLRAEAERKQAQAKKKHDEMYADINYISDWMDGHKVSDSNNTMLASEGFKEGAAAASGKDIFGIAKTAKEYISENTGKLSTAAINDYVNGMLAANRVKEKYGDKFSYILEPIDSVVLENKDIPDSVKKEFVKVRTPKEFGDNNYQTILGNAVDDFVRLFEKEYRREQGKAGKKAMEDYDNIAKNPFADADDKDAARMVYASKVLTGVDLKPMIDRAFNSIPKDRMAALTLALSKDFGYDENKAAEYIANEFQRVCLARTGAKVNSDTEAVIIGGLMNTLVGSIAQASMRSTGGGNGLTLLDAYSASIDERAKEWAKQGLAGYGKIALRSATTMAGDSPAFGGIGKLVGSGTKWSLVRLLPRISKGVTPKAGEAAFKMLSMTNSGRVVIGVANGAGLGAIYSPAAYSLGSLARGVTPELGEALKSSASGAVDFSMMGFTPSIMNYGADKVLKLFNGTGKAATAIRVATNIAFKDIFGPGANAALVTAKDVLLSSEKISEDLKSYYFEKFGEFLGMHVPGKLSNIRHIADEYKVRTQLNESVFTKEELRSLGYKSVKQMFDDIYAPNGKNDPGYFMDGDKAIASKLYSITTNPKVLESAKMKLLTAIGGGAIATPTITRSEIVSEYGEKGKEVYTVRTYTADGKAFSERDFGSLKDAKLEETRLGTVIKRNNVAIAEGARDAQWMDTCSERATRAVLSELNGTATEKELTDMLKTAFEKDRNGEQLTDGEKRMLKRFDEVYLQNLRSENADNSSSVRRDFNKSRGVDIDKILAKDYYKWSESEREAVDEYIKALNGENTAKDMPSEQTEPTAPSEPPAEPANEPPVVEAEKGGQQDVTVPEKEAEKPSEETPSKDGVGIEDYIKINKADDETANDIREDAENYTDEVDALRAESEQAVRYSNGESSERPEHWDYWKEKFGLEEPKAKTEEDVRTMEEPKADSEPIEPADEKPTEQPMGPKVEEKPVEVETPKEEAKADTKAEVEQAAGTEPVEEADKHKEEQLDIINKSNPMHDEYHTGVRNVDDIKTLDEAVKEDGVYAPDYTEEDAKNAVKSGEITVYSSKPIENGVFVTPSKMEAENYAGGEKVYSKKVPISDVAWIDTMEGQYARIDNKKSQEESRNGAFGTIYKQFKGKAKEAIAWLIQKKEGEAIGALHHRDVGDISLVWGNDNAGLKKILQKHPEVVDNLQDLIDEMHVISSSDNRVVLESETHKAVVSKKIGKENTPQWLLTAYEKKDASGGSSDIGPEPQRGKQNGTAPLQDIAPDSKDTHEVTEEQEKQRKNADKSPNSVAYKKGEELVVEHEGNPTTIVVDAVGKDGNVTKSHVKSSGEPYHSNGKVVFTPKEKPQEQAVKDWVDDTASEARKRGYRIVNGQKVERQSALSEGTEVVYGDEHTTKFSQNDKPTTRFAVVSAKKMQPSHIRGQRNPAFFNDEGQPKNRTDQVSVAREEEIAKNIDPEEITVGVTAYQGAPTINSRGEVIQGNNRAAALREMYSGGYGMSVKKYRQFLKDNAKMFGLTPEDIDRIEDPVLVNVADVADAEAIRLGQLKATDNESGGVQFIEPKPTVQKLVGANKLTRFMDTLLDSENPMDSIKDLIRKNGVKALKFMRDMGIINETQYNSAFNAKDTLSSQARNDLEGVIRHAMFDGGPTGIEEMFDLMPDAAQKGILETIARDFSSDEQSRIKPIIQESILAYHNAVSTSKEFANAKTAEQAARAMRNYVRQVQLIGEEQVLPEKYFSKFALLLAERYRAYSKLSIKAMFNELYDKLQGVSESSGDLFAGEVAAEKLNINEAFKKVFNYGDTELPRGDVLGDTARTGTKGEQGSEGGVGGRGQDKAGERGADGKGGVDSTAEEGSNHVTGTAAKAADKDSYDVTEDTAKYRIREDAPPTKTGIGYKVFVLKDGKLYPPMVANPNGEATPVGVWLDADAAPVIGVTKTGRQQVKAGGKGTQGGSGKLAYRPGWHLGEIPYALQFNRMNPETGQRELFPANFVWAEVEYANDVDYQEEAMSYGMKASGKFQHSLAGLPRLPKNGSYRYRTNPDPNTDPWVITGAMKVNRILKPSEVDAMIEAAGREPQQRQAGSITDKQVEALNAKVERTMQEDRDMMRSVVQQMGEKLHTDINIIEDVNEITHSNAAVQERRRKSKGWYDTKTGQVNIVLANNRDVDDVKASVGHEVIAHKGLRELFGEENYDQFLDETYQHLRDDLKKGVDAASGRSFVDDATKNGNRAKSYEQHRRTAVDELFGRMAEKPFEEFSEGERTLWQKTKATVRRLLDKFLGSLKLPKWFELSDNELRYILWRSKERLERGKEHPIDLARDIVKREELGLTDEALYNMGDNPETFAERQRRAVEKKGVVMSGLNSAEVTAVKVPKHPYTGNIAHATEQAKAAAIEKYTEIIKDERGKEKRVAKPQTYDNYGVTFQYGISADAIDEYLNPRQQAKSVNKGVHLALAEHIHEVIGASIEVEEHPDRMKVEGERSNNQFNPNSLMHRFYGVVLVDGHPYRVMTLMREEKNPAVGNGMHAYEVQKIEVLDEETPNTPNGTDSQNHNGLSYPVAKVIEKVEKTMESGKNLLEESKIADEDTAMYRDPGETEDIRFRKVEGYDSKHAEIERAVNKKLKRGSTSDDIKAEIDSVKKLRAEATKEYLSGKPHSEVAKGDAAALRERLNELNAKKTIAVENERSAKLTEKLADLNSKLIEATEGGDTEKAKSLTTEIKRLKTDIGNTGIRSRYKAKISEIKSKSENVSDLAKSLVKYISGELSPILAKEMGKAEFNALVGSVRDIAKQWNAKDGTEQDRNNLATKIDDTIRKVDDVIVGIETRKLINDLADMLSVKTTKKDSSGKKIGVKVSNTVRIAIETLKGMFRGFDGEFGNGLKSLVKSLDGMLAKKKSLQGRLKELELSEASVNERLNSGAITKDEYDAEIEAINRERDDVKSEMANFDTVFSDALSETNDAIDTAVPRTTEEYNKLLNDLMAKQQDEQDGVAQMSAHDKEMLKIMPFVRSLVDVRELFAEADKSQSRLKALEEQWKSDAPTPTDTEMESANRRDRRLQTALKIREERARLFAAKDAARKALRDLNNDVRSLLKIGKTQYMAQQQERLEHRSEVAHISIAAVDTGKERPAGVKGQQEAKESEDKSVGVLRRLWNWVFLAPTESAESMLSRVDVNHFSGEGELYHLIMESERGYSRSEDRRIESVEALRSEIQSKCKELFGSKKPKDGNKRIKFTQTLSGEPVPAEVTKGEALSLYLWSLSEEGRAKLESQGIDAFSISEIKAGLGDNWVKFGEWVVGDFLPKLYDKYNEKYIEKYGTEITRHENYFPFKIYGGDIVTKDELESFDNGNTIPMPSALKERVKHNYQLSTTEDALKILNEHVAEMEDWYHFADMREDISILLSSRAFRETLKLQGPNKWRKFRDAMHTLAGVDKRDESVTSQVINEAQSMYASSAVGFRYWTALKQLQSMIAGVNHSYNPRFLARLFANILMPVGTELLAGKVKNVENTFAGMVGSCYWAWKNLPQFRERYRNGKMGNIMLEYESVVGNSNSLYRWIKKNVSQKGLFLNQVFDAAAVAVYAKSIYDYEYTRSIRKGATEEDAHKYAMTCAETNYNKTQQSSGRAYVSKMQVSGNPIEKGLTTFQTASLGFMRKSINDINDIQRAYRLLRLGKEKPLHSISRGAKATVDLLWDGVVMPASWNLINVIGVAGFYYGAKAIFNALFGGDDDNAPIKDATGKTALDRFIEGHAGDVAFATISAPLQGTILNNLVNSAWSGYGGWTPTMAEGAISEVLRSAGETLKGYKDSDSLSGYIEDLDEDAAKYTIKTVLYALFRGYTGIDMKTVERFYNAFYDYKVNGSSLNLISAANFLSTPMSSMRDHEAKDYYLGAYGKTSETAKDLEDYIVKRAYADGKIFKREVESGGARGKVAELFRSRAFKRDLNKYVDEWAEYHIKDASDAADYHDEWLKNHERKEIIRKNRELEYSDEQAKQKTDSLKLSLGYEQKSGNSERTLRYNLVHDILRQIKKKLTGGDNDRKEAFALMKELERIDKVKGHTHSDYVKLAEKAGVKDFQMIPKGVSESGKYVNKSDIDNGTVARGEVKGSYGIIATADDVKADARFRKLQDGSEKQKAKAKEVMKMYSDGDISYQDAYRRMTDIGDGLVTAVYASEADRLIKDLKTKLTKAVKAGDDKAADAIMEQIRSIRGKVIDGDMKPKEEVAKMLLNSIE